LLDRKDLVGRGGRAAHLENAHLIVARIAALEADITAVTVRRVIQPAPMEAALAGRGADILFFGVRRRQEVDAARFAQRRT
jgi:hypothetical protein